jgi:multi-sensor hybrid histidine kinase (EC 2.7.3.-)
MSSSLQKKIRILLAEDNPANQLVARKLLEKLGYTIDIVSNGEEALKVWSNYDLILMDCQMPVMDGYTATKAIRAQQTPDQKVLIVAMTANAMESDRQYCLECGVDEYITKPISLERLRELFQWVWRKIEAF